MKPDLKYNYAVHKINSAYAPIPHEESQENAKPNLCMYKDPK